MNAKTKKTKKTIMDQFLDIMQALGYADNYNPKVGGNALPENGVATYGWLKGELRNWIDMANEEGEPLWEDVFGDERIPACRNAYNRAKRMLKKIEVMADNLPIK